LSFSLALPSTAGFRVPSWSGDNPPLPALRYPSPLLPFSLPLELGPLIAARGSGSAVKMEFGVFWP